MKHLIAILAFAAICAMFSTTLTAQIGATATFAVTPTSLTIGAGGSGTVALMNKGTTPMDWKLVQPLPIGFNVEPQSGTLRAMTKEVITIKALGRAGDRATLAFLNSAGEKVSVVVTIAAAGVVTDKIVWNLLPTEGIAERGKSIPVRIQNASQVELKWKVGILPAGVTVQPQMGSIPAGGSANVQVGTNADGVVGATSYLVPFFAANQTKTFKLTIKAPISSPTDLQPR